MAILEEKTYDIFGYYSWELAPKSKKKIVVICDDCGEDRTIVKNSYSPFCRACAHRGERSPLWKGGEVERICLVCGKTFKVEQNVVKRGGGNCCSLECRYEAQRKGEVVKCLQCGQEFYRTNAAAKKNRGKYCSQKCHGLARVERIKVICQQCGKEFEAEPGQIKQGGGKHCSRECAALARNKRIKVICQQCGKEFETHAYRPKKGRGKFCSRKCMGEWASENLTGEKARKWQNKRITKKCQICGKTFYTYEHILRKGGGKFCSVKCRSQWVSVNFSGENSPHWKGGKSFEPYCPKFNEAFREQIREKFGRVCFICGCTEAENGKRLSVHHVNYSKDCLCDDDKTCQFVPLCNDCHLKTNNKRDYWEELIMNKLRARIDGYYI